MQNRNASKEKKSPRFGVLDAMIILLVVALVIGIYFRSNIIDWISNQRNIKDYTVTFAVDNIRYTTPNYINVGDSIVFATSGEEFGTIIEESDGKSNNALSVTPSSESFIKDGKMIEVFYPNNESRVDVKGRLQCQGSYSEDGGFLVNGSTYLSAGQTVKVRTEFVTLEIRILAIEAVE